MAAAGGTHAAFARVRQLDAVVRRGVDDVGVVAVHLEVLLVAVDDDRDLGMIGCPLAHGLLRTLARHAKALRVHVRLVHT